MVGLSLTGSLKLAGNKDYKMTEIIIAESFSAYPAGRYPDDGPHNGQDFRERFLMPVLAAGGSICLCLDGIKSFADSFFDEALGGLIRNGYTKEELSLRLKLDATEPVARFFLPEVKAHLE